MLPEDKPILSLETATPVCSVGLRMPDGTVFEERAEGKGVHSELAFVFSRQLLDRQGLEIEDLGAVWVSAGPGSYTGLRVAGSAVKGMLFQTGIPLYAYSTLGAIALGVRSYQMSDQSGNHQEKKDPAKKSTVDTVIDARRVHLYHQRWHFEAGVIRPESNVKIRELDEVLSYWQSGRLVAGTGIDRLNRLADSRGLNPGLRSQLPGDEVISAIHIFDLLKIHEDGQVLTSENLIEKADPERFEPFYN